MMRLSVSPPLHAVRRTHPFSVEFGTWRSDILSNETNVVTVGDVDQKSYILIPTHEVMRAKVSLRDKVVLVKSEKVLKVPNNLSGVLATRCLCSPQIVYPTLEV